MGKVAAIDYGQQRIGLALSDEGRRYAFSRGTFSPRDFQVQLREMLQEEQVDLVVVGLPLDQHGREGNAAQLARSFGTFIEEQFRLPVRYEDERFTTVYATKLMRQGGRSDTGIDAEAARLILQTYLDKKSNE